MLRHIPNLVTVLRGVGGIAGAWLLLQSAGAALEETAVFYAVLSGLIFVAAALTDWLDGWLARRFSAASALGALLDPIADKMLTGSYLIAYTLIAGGNPALAVPVGIILLRDIIVTGVRLSGPPRSEGAYAVTNDAKAKTALTMIVVALPFVLIAMGFVDVADWFYIWVGGVWLCAALTVWSAIPYLRAALKNNLR
ncbi:CDP-alcohol phosphatidyltransferase family protein [Glycocaulis abyssi]|uniref:CDP-diacylglycerol--glycerol-3-phosphate 3-phosphatidyltransferase n=1 Tax=Glycocaulis abyssi TaxID=1433403 RepID=A0ABV9NFL7_9PROT